MPASETGDQARWEHVIIFLFARLAAEIDEDRPQHIVQDFAPTFAHLETLGLVQVWQDEWLWGHRAFSKV